MQLHVVPYRLIEAAIVLDRCGDELLMDLDRFVSTAAGELPGVGKDAEPGAATTARHAVAAVHSIISDLHTMSLALQSLAAGYDRLDTDMLREPEPGQR